MSKIVTDQVLVTHRGDEVEKFNSRIATLIKEGWQPEGPSGVMNMPKFEFYQTMRRYATPEVDATGQEYDLDNEHPEYTLEDWHYDVRNGDTQLGYTEWVLHNIESHSEDVVWKPVPADHVRLVYVCPGCNKEYVIGVEEASIPFCTDENCVGNGEETDFERAEVRL